MKNKKNNIINTEMHENITRNKEEVPVGSFGWALLRLKDGFKVARKGWNDSEKFLAYIPSKKLWCGTTENRMDFGDYMYYEQHIIIKMTDGSIGVGWSPTNADLFAEDWYEFE